jgi:hypothetical protein
MARVARRNGPASERKPAPRWLSVTLTVAGVVAVALTIPITRSVTQNGAAGRSSVPVEFRHACGHPGSHVVARHLPVTVRHADCDLTGVDISAADRAGAYVPRRELWGGEIANSSGFHLMVDDDGNVTVRVVGPPGIM